MILQLLIENSKALSIDFVSFDKDVLRKKKSFNLGVGNSFDTNNPNEFSVLFDISIQNPQYDLKIKYIYMFSSNQEITEEFKVSTFPSVNAPAIAFPFLRSFISSITLQAGYSPIILPSINFTKEIKKENEVVLKRPRPKANKKVG